MCQKRYHCKLSEAVEQSMGWQGGAREEKEEEAAAEGLGSEVVNLAEFQYQIPSSKLAAGLHSQSPHTLVARDSSFAPQMLSARYWEGSGTANGKNTCPSASPAPTCLHRQL